MRRIISQRPDVMAGMTPGGTTQITPMLRALLGQPQDNPGLIGNSIADAKSRKPLKRAAMVSAPLFGDVSAFVLLFR